MIRVFPELTEIYLLKVLTNSRTSEAVYLKNTFFVHSTLYLEWTLTAGRDRKIGIDRKRLGPWGFSFVLTIIYWSP